MNNAVKLGDASDNRKRQVITLFDNLVTLNELLTMMPFSRAAVHRWVKRGMPHEKIRGRLFFDPREVAIWLKRT